MRYGLPYQGSKNDIAQWVIDHLPPADVLIDAFAGGCAITHCALLSHKFKRVIANDVNDMPQLFVDAIRGKYRNETRWISREDFFALKDTDPYVRVCWSFSNNGECYIYGEKIEQYKKGYHYATLFDDYSLWDNLGVQVPKDMREKGHTLISTKRRLMLMKWVWKNADSLREILHVDTSNKGLNNLESLQRLESIQHFRKPSPPQSCDISSLQGDYTQIPPPTSETYTIYCDPPYFGTNCGAYSGFDHDRFYEWLRSMSVPVVVSEYSMPSDFVLIDECTKQIKSDSKGQHKGAERLFCHESTIDKLPKTTLF